MLIHAMNTPRYSSVSFCCRWQQKLAQLDLEKPEFKQNADDEIAEYLTMSDEAGDEIRRLKPELVELEEEVRPQLDCC